MKPESGLGCGVTFVTASAYHSLYDLRLLPPIIRSNTNKNDARRGLGWLSDGV